MGRAADRSTSSISTRPIPPITSIAASSSAVSRPRATTSRYRADLEWETGVREPAAAPIRCPAQQPRRHRARRGPSIAAPTEWSGRRSATFRSASAGGLRLHLRQLPAGTLLRRASFATSSPTSASFATSPRRSIRAAARWATRDRPAVRLRRPTRRPMRGYGQLRFEFGSSLPIDGTIGVRVVRTVNQSERQPAR